MLSKNPAHSGSCSYIISCKGSPAFPRLPLTPFTDSESLACLYVNMSISEEAAGSPAPLSHLLPETYFLPSPKEIMFILQLEVQPRQFADLEA